MNKSKLHSLGLCMRYERLFKKVFFYFITFFFKDKDRKYQKPNNAAHIAEVHCSFIYYEESLASGKK